MNLRKRYRKYITYTGTAGMLALSVALTGCSKEASGPGDGNATPSEVTEIQAVPETIAQLGLQGQVLPGLNDVDLPDAEPAPEYLRIGVRHEIVKKLQLLYNLMPHTNPQVLRRRLRIRQVDVIKPRQDLSLKPQLGNGLRNRLYLRDFRRGGVPVPWP